MRELKLEDDKAKELYKTGSSELKTILEQSFPDLFPKKLADKVRNRERVTWEEILVAASKTDEQVVPWRNPVNKAQRSQNALARIQLITEMVNKSLPDFTKRSEYKWAPWFERTASGWVVYGADRYLYDAYGGFGCYYNEEGVAKWAGSNFIDIYTEYLP